MIHSVSVPGKLFLAGEYAVTSGKCSAIIAPVPRYLTVTIKPSTVGRISSTKYKHHLVWHRQDGKITSHHRHFFKLIMTAMSMTEQFLKEHDHTVSDLYHIHIKSQLDDKHSHQKFGLGSSGAVTVATIRALLDYANFSYSLETVFKLACITHLSLNSRGSFGDLAVSTYGTCIAYRLFDKDFVQEQLENCSISEVVNAKWPNLFIEALHWPKDLCILVGWTGRSASTEKLVMHINSQKQKSSYNDFITSSQDCVQHLIEAFQAENIVRIKREFRKNRQLLSELSPHIETDQLKKLCRISEQFNCASKVSGAGGGDCGFCVIGHEHEIYRISRLWKKEGILPLMRLGGYHDSFHS